MNNSEKNTYVRTQILNALLEMMKSEDFNSITIKNLTDKAQVGRASFYRNFASKEDVLLQEAERLNLNLKALREKDDPIDMQLKIVRTLDFYKDHEDFYMTLYNGGFTQIIQDSIVEKTIQNESMPALLAYTASAFSYLVYGWVIEWIRRGMKESSAELIAMFESSNVHIQNRMDCDGEARSL